MIDSHCHLNDPAFKDDLGQVISKAISAGVHTMLCIGYDWESSVMALAMADQHPAIYAAVGFHPENIEGVDISELAKIRELAKHPKVIAIGEIGLDYHWYKKDEWSEYQKKWFLAQIELANELNLPISVHSRDANQDIYDFLKEHPVKAHGVMHCYSGSAEMIKGFADLGFYFGFGGTTTFKNAKTPKECAAACPLDRILLETDSPYLTPHPYRGQRNDPSYIPLVLKEIAHLREMDEKELEEATDKNFQNLFHVKL